MQNKSMMFVALAACGWVWACGGSDDDTPSDALMGVQAIFDRACIGCHGGSPLMAPMSLEADQARDNLVNVVVTNLCASGTMRVATEEPDNSCLWQLVDSDTMPLGGPALPDADKATIRAWIEAGAPE